MKLQEGFGGVRKYLNQRGFWSTQLLTRSLGLFSSLEKKASQGEGVGTSGIKGMGRGGQSGGRRRGNYRGQEGGCL